MYKVIYTKMLDNADDAIAESLAYDNYKDAKAAFDEHVKKLVGIMLENDICTCKMSMHNNIAAIKIEGEHHCLALKEC